MGSVCEGTDTTVFIQARDDGGVGQGSISRNGEKKLDFRQIFEIEPTGFSDGLNVLSKRKNEEEFQGF